MSDSNHSPGTSDVLERNVEQLLGRAHEPPRMAEEARTRVLAALHQHVESRRAQAQTPRPRLGRRPWIAAGATLAIGAAAALVVAAVGGGSAGFAPTAYDSGAEVQTVALADGTSLVLNQDARAVLIGPRHLRIERGDVLLDVARGSEPFVVDAPHGRATVLGTRFLLSADADETRAAVVRGRVRLENERGSQVLGVGQAGELTADRAPTRHAAERLSHLTGWARGAAAEVSRETVRPTRRGVLLARNPVWQEQEFPLPVRNLTVDVRVENQVARVAIDQTFFNPQNQVLEGVYHIVLPPDAAISRQAMYVDGTLMESAVVERQEARRIYEEIVYRRRDPALLEWMTANIYKVRIFPLPARTEKRIAFEYTQSLERLYDDYRLEVPLPEMDGPVGTVQLHARLVGCGSCEVASPSHDVSTNADGDDLIVSYTASNHRVGDDLVLMVRDPIAGARVAEARQAKADYLMVRAQPSIEGGETSRAPRRWVVLHDTSASRGPAERKAQAFLVERFLRDVDEYDDVAVMAFDTTVRTMGNGFARVDTVDLAEVKQFVAAQSRDGVGQTDLGSALDAAIALLDANPGDGEPYVLYLGDGIATGGERELAALQARLSGKATFVGVAVGERMDDRVLRSLASATGGMVSHMNPGDDLEWRAYDLVAALETPRVVGLEATLIDANGAALASEDVYVSAQQLADGEELTVVARLGAERPRAMALRGTVGGQAWTQRIALPAAEDRSAGYLPREWARRRVDALLAAENDESRAEIVELGMEHFLVTPYTSLLVLENDAMYTHYKVSRDRKPRWGEYALPATIPVVTESAPAAAGVSLDAFMARSPLQVFNGVDAGLGYRSGVRVTASLDRGGFDFGDAVVTLSTTPVGGTVSLDSGTGIGFGSGGGGVVTEATATAAASAVDDATVVRGEGEMAQTITTDDLARAGDTWTVREQNRAREFERRNTRGPTRFDGRLSANRGGEFRRGGFGWQDNLQGGFYYDQHLANGLQPIALTYAMDARLDDLTALVPGLVDDSFDVEARALRHRDTTAVGSVSADAAAMIRRARSQLSSGRFEGSDGSVIALEDSGSFRIERVLDSGLREVVSYDGATLEHRYPELGLGMRRDVRTLEAQVLARYVPFAVASEAALQRWFDVTRESANVVGLRRVGAGANADGVIELVFDDRGRMTEVRTRVKGIARVILSVVHRDDALVVGDVTYTVEAAGWGDPVTATGAEIMIEMPLRQPAYWAAELDGQATAARPKRQTQQLLLASWAALGNESELWKLAQEMDQDQALDRGELVLASRGLRAANRKALDRLTRGVDKGDPVAAYMRAARRFADDQRVTAFDELAAKQAGTFVGALAGYRVVLATLWSSNSRERTGRRVEALVRSARAPLFAYLAAHSFSQRYTWQAPRETAQLWDDVAERAGATPWRHYAATQAARALYNGRLFDRASARYEALLAELPDGVPMPMLDTTAQWTFRQSARGEAGWKLFWARWREACEARGDVRSTVSLMQSATMVGEQRDVERAAARLVSMDIGDGMLASEVAATLYANGRTDSALAVLAPHLRAAEPAPSILALASAIAERQGRLADAASYLERAIAAEADEELSLAQVRQDGARMLSLYARMIETDGEAPRAIHVAKALEVVADWRAIDPDNPQIDTLAAQVLFAADDYDQARRYLSTAIELHPGEGTAYETVASALEAEGRVTEAAPLWLRAVEVEPTNPTWLMRRANALFALGQTEEARTALERISEGTWHDRFAGVTYQAKRLLEQQ